jgi:predicted acetyltransferase
VKRVPASRKLELQKATSEDADTLANLLELYAHDLSDVFDLELSHDGRYGYKKLQLYFSEPATRFAFLIKHGGQLVGFALVTRGSPASRDPNVLDMAEFFVVRRHRRGGIGRQAAFLLWNELRGHWFVRVSGGNKSGREFWSRIVQDYTGGVFSESARPGTLHPWQVFEFKSPPSRSP